MRRGYPLMENSGQCLRQNRGLTCITALVFFDM